MYKSFTEEGFLVCVRDGQSVFEAVAYYSAAKHELL